MLRYSFTDEDCRTAGTCVCGMCKRYDSQARQVDCEWGDCRQAPAPGKRDCLAHVESREYVRTGYWDPWAPVGSRATRPAPPVSTQEETKEGETDG